MKLLKALFLPGWHRSRSTAGTNKGKRRNPRNSGAPAKSQLQQTLLEANGTSRRGLKCYTIMWAKAGCHVTIYLPTSKLRKMVKNHTKKGRISKKTLAEWAQPLKEEQILMVKEDTAITPGGKGRNQAKAGQ